MGRVSVIKSHKNKKAIETAVLRGVSLRSIAEKYGFSEAALRRYRDKYMPKQLIKAQEKDLELSADNLQETVRALFKKAQNYLSAAEADLIDPETGKVTWLPHASEVEVLYYKQVGDKQARKKENLQILINRVMEQDGSKLESFMYKHADARREAARYLDVSLKTVETLAKLMGEMDTGDTTVTINNTIVDITEIILKATKGYPKIRKKIVERIKRLEGSGTID